MTRIIPFACTLFVLTLTGSAITLAQTAQEPPTEVYVRTLPPGAKVLVDGKQVGTSDDLFDVTPGLRTITVEMEGYQSTAKEITVPTRRIKRVVFELKRNPKAAKDNLLTNPGAEDGKKNPENWKQGMQIPGVKYSWDKKVAFEGKASLCIEKKAQRFFPIASWTQTIKRKGDAKTLELSAQVKARKMAKAVLDVLFLDENDQWISHKWAAYIGSKKQGQPPATHHWKKYSGKVEIPPRTAKIVVGLQVYGPGKVWFDDVRVNEVNKDGDGDSLIFDGPLEIKLEEVNKNGGSPSNRLIAKIATSDTTDEAAIKKMIAKFVESSVRDDRGAAVECLSKRSHHMLDQLGDIPEMISVGFKPAEINTVSIVDDHALAVTDFVRIRDSKYKNPVCIVYTVVNRAGRWVIEDIDVEDINKLGDKIPHVQAKPGKKLVRVSKKVFLPDADTKNTGVVLDLGSGEMLAAGEENRNVLAFTKLGKGDLMYDQVLGCLRGGTAMQWDGQQFVDMQVFDKRKDATAYKLPKTPCRLLITTAEKKHFDVKILSVTDQGGINLEYREADPDLVPKEETAPIAALSTIEQVSKYADDMPSQAVLQELHDLRAEITRLKLKKKYFQVWIKKEPSRHKDAPARLKQINERLAEINRRLDIIHRHELGKFERVAVDAKLGHHEEPMFGQGSYGIILYATASRDIKANELLLYYAAGVYRTKGSFPRLETTGAGWYFRPNQDIPSGKKFVMACIQDAPEEIENRIKGSMPDSGRARKPDRPYRAQVFIADLGGYYLSSDKTPYREAYHPMMELVRDFFRHNFRDITSRHDIEWADYKKHMNGNRSIRYKYLARIRKKDWLVMNQVFTFDPQGKFINYENVKGFPVVAGESDRYSPSSKAKVQHRTVGKKLAEFPEQIDLSTPESAWAAYQRANVRKDAQGVIDLSWVKNDPDVVERFWKNGDPADLAIYHKALRDSECVEILVYRDNLAAVISHLPFPPGKGRHPYSRRSFGLINGKWKNLGEDRCPTLEDARAGFDKKKEGIWAHFQQIKKRLEGTKP